MKRNAEELCQEYAEAVAERRKQHAILSAKTCELADANGVFANGHSCLDSFFEAPRSPEGEFMRFSEFFDPMCDVCKGKLGALSLRKVAGIRIGAVNRSIEHMGKRILRERL